MFDGSSTKRRSDSKPQKVEYQRSRSRQDAGAAARRSSNARKNREFSHLHFVVAGLLLLLLCVSVCLIYLKYQEYCRSCVALPTVSKQTGVALPEKTLTWGILDLSNRSESQVFTAMQNEAKRLMTSEARGTIQIEEEQIGLSVPYPLELDLEANMAAYRKAKEARQKVELQVIWRIQDKLWETWYKALLQTFEERQAKLKQRYDFKNPNIEAQVRDYLLQGRWQSPLILKCEAQGEKGDPQFEGLTLVAEASTPNNTPAPGRDLNLKRAAELLNGVKIRAGAVFSYLRTVGPVTAENGYHDAGVQADGLVVSGVGGGLCQPSSTLFQAAVLSGSTLTFPVKFNHSVPVLYCPLGEDAMVSDWADLQIYNAGQEDYTIQALFDGASFTVRLYGPALPEGTTVQMRVEHLGYEEPGPDEYRHQPDLPNDEIKVVRKRMKGQVTELFRDFYKDGKRIRSESLGKNRYEAFSGIYEYRNIDALDEETQALIRAQAESSESAESQAESGRENTHEENPLPTETERDMIVVTKQGSPLYP